MGLRRLIRGWGRIAVAYSGGVDSAVLLHVAHGELGDAAAGVIADSPSLPRRELRQARDLAGLIGVRLQVVKSDEMNDPRYRANAGDRCYFCKSALFTAMRPWAQENGFTTLAFGEITDDLLDDRPGARAAGEFGVVAPLREAGFSKEDVRRYAREAGLPVADKPAAACLASRIPVGTAVSRELLARVEAAESALHQLGLRQVRVRHHGFRAQVEVAAGEMDLARSLQERLHSAVRSAGFAEMTLHTYLPPADRHQASAASVEGEGGMDQ